MAQKLCNHLARDLDHARDGEEVCNLYRSGELQPLGLDQLHRVKLARLRQDERWKPPKGALDALLVVAMLVWRWSLPKHHKHAGERCSGILASNEIMAELAGCHPDTWARYGRPFLEHMDLLVGLPTMKRSRAGWKARTSSGPGTGAQMPHREHRTLYVPGDALWDLLGRRERRIERSHRRLLAEARRQLGKSVSRPARLRSQDRKNPDPKAVKKNLSTRDIFFTRARGPMPLAHQHVRTWNRRGRTVRPAAAATSTRRAPSPESMSTATAVDVTARDDQRLVTKGGSAGAAGGAELETPRQCAPDAAGEANPPAGVSASPAPPNASSATSSRTTPNRAEPPAADCVVEPSGRNAPLDGDAEIRAALAAYWRSQGIDPGAPTESSATPPNRAGPVNFGSRIRGLARGAQSRVERRAGAPPPMVTLVGDERTPAEEAANKRRRAESLARARRESERIGGDEPPSRSSPPTDDEGDDT